MHPSAVAVASLPPARGPLSQWLLDRLRSKARRDDAPAIESTGLSADLQLALYLAYELHYSALPGVRDELEWDPEIIAFRRQLERAFEASLLGLVGSETCPDPIRRAIPAMIDNDDGPSVSRHMEANGTLDQMREILIHRSLYQLKEADPHTFAIPRLDGRVKQMLVAIQAGEYGADAPDRLMHSVLFAQAMRGLGLDARRHAYLGVVPASSLALSNMISMFGLNRRWRGALVGHLAVFEMTSVTPMGRYARGLERMGASPEVRRFYDVHVLADAEHEAMALDMAEALAEDEPWLQADIIFGARCTLAIERLFAEDLFGRWKRVNARARVAA
jgi:hypothetical protein